MMLNPRGDDDVAARLRDLEARVARLDADLLDLTGDGESGDNTATAEHSPTPAFGSVDEWVDDYFLVVFTRPVGGSLRWCHRWREHPEAVLRLEAMWRSWETLRLDGNVGMATWLTSFADPLLSALLQGQGTFAGCTRDRHDARATAMSG